MTWLLYLGSSGAGGDLESMGRRHVREDYGVGLCLGRGEAETALALGAERPGLSQMAQRATPFRILPGFQPHNFGEFRISFLNISIL